MYTYTRLVKAPAPRGQRPLRDLQRASTCELRRCRQAASRDCGVQTAFRPPGMNIGLFAGLLASAASSAASHPFGGTSDLEYYFFNATRGAGLWKWRHYFTVYDKHLARFRGKNVKLIEVGIYSGGGLRMWRHYLGKQATIAGLDIAPEVRAYDKNPALGSPDRIYIGSQADPKLWATIADEMMFDVILDDGGHTAELQIAMLDVAFQKNLNVGGVYIIEDLISHVYGSKLVEHIVKNYISGPDGLHACVLNGNLVRPTPVEKQQGMDMKCPLHSYVQRHVAEVAFYHNMVVLTKLPRGGGGYLSLSTIAPRDEGPFLSSFKKGTTWAPGSFWKGQREGR